jgi:NAD(P)-dependent dehydrogenase (short-subunit alcohol dehydrogenase family)
MIANRIYEGCTSGLPSLSGKCYAITGTTSGTGYYTAVAAIEKGASAVLLLNRTSERSSSSEGQLKRLAAEKGATTEIQSVDCDLQSFASVVRAAIEVNEIAAIYDGLDGCINNAGVMALPDVRTADGYDVQMQTNHLSHFLLTKLIMPSLESAAKARGEARVVQHSSGARSKGLAPDGNDMLQERFMNPSSEGELGGNGIPECFNRYHQTKLANSVFMLALHDSLKASGSKIKSLCAEPGVAKTDLMQNLSLGHKKVNNTKGAKMGEGDPSKMFPGVQSAADGACPLMEAAFGAGAHSGDFYMPGERVKNTTVGKPTKCMTAGQPSPSNKYIRERFEHEVKPPSTQNDSDLYKY